MTWLCADVGGTNTRLAAWHGKLGEERRWSSSGALDLSIFLERWLNETGVRPTAACLAIAGPVHENRCATTNLPWVIDGEVLGARFGFPVTLVNDFYAAALGVTRLAPNERVQLGGGPALADAPIAVLGAGTGLGEAWLLPGGRVVPGEGGHTEFGPGNAQEVRLAQWLLDQDGRATWESVLSGPGLVNLARFWCEDTQGSRPTWLDAGDTSDTPPRILKEFPEVIAWFAELYGCEAGNAALRILARGGVYLCGGIAPAILPELQQGGFRRRFEAKGKVSEAIREIPVYVVLNDALGLLGAAAELERRHHG